MNDPLLRQHLSEDGRLLRFPKRHQARQAALLWLAGKFQPEQVYGEREVNEIIAAAHTFTDHTLLRRELIDHGFLARTTDGARYWRTDKTE